MEVLLASLISSTAQQDYTMSSQPEKRPAWSSTVIRTSILNQVVNNQRRLVPFIKYNLIVGATLGDLLTSVPSPGARRGSRGSWPLSWSLGRPKLPRVRTESPLRQTTLGRDGSSHRTDNTPSPATPQERGVLRCLFPKFDRGDRSPTGRLVSSPPAHSKEARMNNPRRCCGLRPVSLLAVILLVAMIIVAAVIAPIIVIRNRNTAAPSGLSLSQCRIQQPCQNNGASIIVNGTTCACLCAGGFSGAVCATRDSSCQSISIQGGRNDTSIGSAIQPLLQVAAADFSNQFTLSPQRIVERFAADNISCTSQNSLVTINGSTAAIPVAGSESVGAPAIVFVRTRVWAVTTITSTFTITFFTTLPYINVLPDDSTVTGFSTGLATSVTTHTVPTSTFSVSTRTMTSVPSATGLTQQDLVFGRCVILAVVQELGVSVAVGVQRLLQTAVQQGLSVVDTGLGLTIDLFSQTISGLPNSAR